MITVKTIVKAPLSKVWAYWTQPEHIVNWNQASDDWHTPKASNDLTVEGKFNYTMAAKDGSMSFDFEGTYTTLQTHERIEYEIIDGRKVNITFETTPEGVLITESFDPETLNPNEMQRQGWQNILDSFKKYTEQN
ncbi:SRPBCC family protein [Flavobacterium sp. XGLA_31]|uniref:SRPBCC family protein n=1 Tax=Flavobacterium sp. XGLA_31 TaxID=3447666 RepID=UPI003F3750C0